MKYDFLERGVRTNCQAMMSGKSHMLIRSALRMEHYKSLGLKTFAEIRKHGGYGNNVSANINKDLLERYDDNLNKKGILIESLTNPENVSI